MPLWSISDVAVKWGSVTHECRCGTQVQPLQLMDHTSLARRSCYCGTLIFAVVARGLSRHAMRAEPQWHTGSAAVARGSCCCGMQAVSLWHTIHTCTLQTVSLWHVSHDPVARRPFMGGFLTRLLLYLRRTATAPASSVGQCG